MCELTAETQKEQPSQSLRDHGDVNSQDLPHISYHIYQLCIMVTIIIHKDENNLQLCVQLTMILLRFLLNTTMIYICSNDRVISSFLLWQYSTFQNILC